MKSHEIKKGKRYYHSLHGWVKIVDYHENEDGYYFAVSKDGKRVVVADFRLLGEVKDGEE